MNKIEAIKRIQDHIEVHKIGKYPHIQLAEAFDAAIAALRAQLEPDGWINTSDRMPDQYERVIVFIADDSDVGYREARTWKSAYRDGWCVPLEHVTHWRPLPKPPRET